MIGKVEFALSVIIPHLIRALANLGSLHAVTACPADPTAMASRSLWRQISAQSGCQDFSSLYDFLSDATITVLYLRSR